MEEAKHIRVYSGTAHPQLAQQIADGSLTVSAEWYDGLFE